MLLTGLFFSFAPAQTWALDQIDNPLLKVNQWFILLSYNPERYDVTPSMILEYEMAIFDSDHHPPLEPLKEKMILIGYVSLGEAEGYRSYWNAIKDEPWVLNENPNWKDNHYVDVRSTAWHTLLLEKVIPDIIASGFDGVELDTIDTSDFLASAFPEKYAGANEAMIELVRKIHERFPKFLLIANNGFHIMEEIGPYLSGCLVESVHQTYDFETRKFRNTPAEETTYKSRILQEIQTKFHLPIFSIEYVRSGNRKAAQKTLKRSRKLNFKTYFAQTELDQIYPQYN